MIQYLRYLKNGDIKAYMDVDWRSSYEQEKTEKQF